MFNSVLHSLKKFHNAKWFKGHWFAYKNLAKRSLMKRLNQRFLYNAELFLDTRCNLKCVHCSISKYQTQKGYSRFMSLEEVTRVADELKKLNCFLCCLVGGELTLRKDLFDIISVFHQRHILPTIITNGILIDEKYIKELKKAGIFNIGVSLNGASANTHDPFVQKEGAYEKAVQTIDLALQEGILTSIAVVPTHENLANGDYQKLIDFAVAKKIRVNVNYPALAGELTDDYEALLTEAEIKIARKYFNLPNVTSDFTVLADKYQCPAGERKIYILPDGSVCPCTFIHISFGNILHEPLEQIMQRLWSTQIFNCQADNCIASESRLFNEVYLSEVFKAEKLPLFYQDHPVFIKSEDMNIVHQIKNTNRDRQ